MVLLVGVPAMLVDRGLAWKPRLKGLIGTALCSLVLSLWPSFASAYRPFEGTDAAVADPGELEVELQPAGLSKQGSDKTLVAPAWVANIGLGQGWEAVFQGQGQFA